MNEMRHRTHLDCIICNTPVDLTFEEVMNSSAMLLCPTCEGDPPRMPRVTLFGAPDGQELSRWTDHDAFKPVQFGRSPEIRPEDIVLEEGTDTW